MRDVKAPRREGTTGRNSRGFTLTEILVVIVLIVLMLALAVPVFNLIKGSRSIDGAENQVAALIGRARTDAIGLQTPHGILFFLDPNSSPAEARVVAVEVRAVDGPANSLRDVYLDRVADTEQLFMPNGVLVMTLNNGTVQAGNPPLRSSDGYLGYNPIPNSQTPLGTPTYVGGVILFGGNGELISRTWGYNMWDAANNRKTQIADELYLPGAQTAQFLDAGPTPAGAGGVPRTSLGMALFDQAAFKNNGDPTDPQMIANGVYNSNGNAEQKEEQWIDDNSTPLLINRFNGTLVRGE